MIKKGFRKVFQVIYKYLSNPSELKRISKSNNEVVVRLGQVFEDSLEKHLNSEEQRIVEKIESLRSELTSQNRKIPATNDPKDTSSDKLAYLANVASKKESWGIFFIKLISKFKPQKGLEFGTCLGLSASYQAATMKLINGCGELITMEGLESRKKLSEQNFEALQLHNISLYLGSFDDILPQILDENNTFDYLFLDGDHRYSATVSNFEKVLPKLKDGSIIIIDDIQWSEGMKKAWKEIIKSEEVSAIFDLFTVGVCIKGKSSIKENYKVSLW